jgi:hypothetical protein
MMGDYGKLYFSECSGKLKIIELTVSYLEPDDPRLGESGNKVKLPLDEDDDDEDWEHVSDDDDDGAGMDGTQDQEEESGSLEEEKDNRESEGGASRSSFLEDGGGMIVGSDEVNAGVVDQLSHRHLTSTSVPAPITSLTDPADLSSLLDLAPFSLTDETKKGSWDATFINTSNNTDPSRRLTTTSTGIESTQGLTGVSTEADFIFDETLLSDLSWFMAPPQVAPQPLPGFPFASNTTFDFNFEVCVLLPSRNARSSTPFAVVHRRARLLLHAGPR